MNEFQKTTRDLHDLGKLVLVAMFLIVIIVLTAKSLLQILISEQLATWGSSILGIVTIFVIIVSKKIREKIMSFGKSK